MARRRGVFACLMAGGLVAGMVLLLVTTLVMTSVWGTPLQKAFEFTPTAFGYLAVVFKDYPATPTSTPTLWPTPTTIHRHTPTFPPPSFDGWQEDPGPAQAGNFPVRIVTVFKTANPEVVRLENVSCEIVDLTGWRMCSITGNQEHTGLSGTLAPGQTKDFAHTGGSFIWNNSERDDGALYNDSEQLVSYWVDQ